MKIITVCVAIALSITTGCAARMARPAAPAAQTQVTGFEIKSLPDFVLVDDLEFDHPVTVTRGPCAAALDCLMWSEDGAKVYRVMQDDWLVTYRFAPTVTEVR